MTTSGFTWPRIVLFQSIIWGAVAALVVPSFWGTRGSSSFTWRDTNVTVRIIGFSGSTVIRNLEDEVVVFVNRRRVVITEDAISVGEERLPLQNASDLLIEGVWRKVRISVDGRVAEFWPDPHPDAAAFDI